MSSHVSKVCRDCKGQSLLAAFDDYIVIDLETTGLSPSDGEIIEFAAVKVRNGEIIDTFSSLANPRCLIDLHITALTGITNDMLAQAPDIAEVLGSFLTFIHGAPLVGHNVSFDVNFLYDSAVRHYGQPVCNDWVDTLRIARRVAAHLPNHKLATLANYYGIPNDQAHRALSDVLCTQKLYEQFKHYFLFDEYLPECRAFGGYTVNEVYQSILEITEDDGNNVELKVNKNNVVVKMFDSVAFTIRINTRSQCILTNNPAASEFLLNFSGSCITTAGACQFPLATTADDVPMIRDMVRAVYDSRKSAISGEPFGCCNDFIRCSDALRCLHLDNPEYVGCAYRKNLEAGKIFYGKNKTI